MGKLKIAFEGKLMPGFYGMLMRNEFRSVAGMIIVIATLITIVGSVMPMQDLAEQSVKREALIRAKVLAREVADRFAIHFANHTETQIDFSFLESEDSIKSVVITNPNLQIVAPATRINQVFAEGKEASFALLVAKRIREGQERGQGTVDANSNLAVWVEPIKVADPRQVQSQVVALVTLSIDFSGNMISAGGTGVVYGTALVVGGLAMILAYLILMRLTSKPYEVLNQELDQVLRGELNRVTREFQIEETKGLWDNINAAAQRIPKGVTQSASDGETQWDQQFVGLRAIADRGGFGMAGFDPDLTFVSLNDLFTEVSGIREDAIGQALTVVADQALAALVTDLLRSVGSSPMRMATDTFSFQGDDYDVVASGLMVKEQLGLGVLFKRRA